VDYAKASSFAKASADKTVGLSAKVLMRMNGEQKFDLIKLSFWFKNRLKVKNKG